MEEFCALVNKQPEIHPAVVEYLKKNYPEDLDIYLKLKENYEELFYLTIEKFFKSSIFEERKKHLKHMKDYLDKLGKNANFDSKFYKQYIKDLENSIHTKKDFLDDKIIPETKSCQT